MRVWLITKNKQIASFLVFMSLWGEFTKSACLFKFSVLIAPCDVNKNPTKEEGTSGRMLTCKTSRGLENKWIYQHFSDFSEIKNPKKSLRDV